MFSGTAAEDLGAALIASRYRDEAASIPEQWNDVLATILSHRSVRSYLGGELPDGTLDLLIAAAQSAASSSNLQCWSVVAVEDPARKSRLAKLAASQNHIAECPLFLVWLADLARHGRIAEDRRVEPEALAYIETLVSAIVDAALAAQNAVLAAESLGLGTVYIGAIRNQPEAVAAELNLPSHILPVFGLCVGYPDPARPAYIKPRLVQSAVLHREQYAADAYRDAVADYDSKIREFYGEQGIKAPDWSQTVTDRVKTPKALNGRDRLSEALRNLGFELR